MRNLDVNDSFHSRRKTPTGTGFHRSVGSEQCVDAMAKDHMSVSSRFRAWQRSGLWPWGLRGNGKREVRPVERATNVQLSLRATSAKDLRGFLSWVSFLGVAFIGEIAVAQTDPSACIAAHADGQVFRAQNKLIASRERFQTCAAADCPPIIRKDCLEFGSAVERNLPTLRLQPRDPQGRPVDGVDVDLDGVRLRADLVQQVIAVDPGDHVFRFRAPDQTTVSVSVRAKTGEKERVVVAEFSDLDRHSTTDPWPIVTYALAGVGGLGIASFVGFGLAGKSLEHDLDKCAPNCTSHGTADRMHTRYLIADISLGVGVLSLGAAAYSYFTHRASFSSATSTSAWTFDVQPTREGAALFTTARF
ncbi:MAG: hypothetical protein QM784_21465 [Polyangiaceae bacterium]